MCCFLNLIPSMFFTSYSNNTSRHLKFFPLPHLWHQPYRMKKNLDAARYKQKSAKAIYIPKKKGTFFFCIFKPFIILHFDHSKRIYHLPKFKPIQLSGDDQFPSQRKPITTGGNQTNITFSFRFLHPSMQPNRPSTNPDAAHRNQKP